MEITGNKPPLSRLETAQEELARAIGDRYILLVVDDVWHAAHIKPFLVKGNHNATLMTTRYDETVPREAIRRKSTRCSARTRWICWQQAFHPNSGAARKPPCGSR